MTSSDAALAPRPGLPRYGCPACGTTHVFQTDGYGNHACEPCLRRATDDRGRRIECFNTSLSGGFEARYVLDGDSDTDSDSGAVGPLAVVVTATRTCFIDGLPFHVEEERTTGHLGGLVARPLAEWLDDQYLTHNPKDPTP